MRAHTLRARRASATSLIDDHGEELHAAPVAERDLAIECPSSASEHHDARQGGDAPMPSRVGVQSASFNLDEVVAFLGPGSKRRVIAPKDFLYQDGARLDSVYLLVRGAVRMTHAHADSRRITSMFLRAPAFVGDAESIAGERAVGGVQALDAVEVIEVPRAAFAAALERFPKLGFEVQRWLSRRLLALMRQHTSLAFDPAASRLINALLDYMDVASLKVGEWDKIRLDLSQEEIAANCGLIRRTFTRTIGPLLDDEVVKKEKGYYYAKRPALEAMRRRTAPDE
jgi:CRP-like cAMP-binding protein